MFQGKDDNSQNLPERDENAILQTYLKADDSLEGKIPCLIRGFIYVYKLSIDLLVDRGTLHTSAVSSRMKHLCASAASFRCLGYYHKKRRTINTNKIA